MNELNKKELEKLCEKLDLKIRMIKEMLNETIKVINSKDY